MAELFATSFVIKCVLSLTTLFLFAKNVKSIHQWLFAYFFSQFVRGLNRDLDASKTELFAPLQEFQSLDRKLREQGLIRILELRVGSGANFKYYPKKARLIAVDPNPYFRKYFDENSAEFPEVDLEKVVLGAGEDMSEVGDGTVDVVVTTFVLCSVTDVCKTLEEIKRVLAPGGKYFFLEHVIGDQGSRYRRLQTLVKPVWSWICEGCDVTRDIGQMIDQAGFSKTTSRTFVAPIKSILRHVVAPHVAGSATK